MRLNLKAVLLILTIAVVVITCVVYMRCAEFTFPRDLVRHWDPKLYEVGSSSDIFNNKLVESNGGAGEAAVVGRYPAEGSESASMLQDVKCLINQEYTVNCKRDEDAHEIYVPFSFLRGYFDISGSLSNPASPQTIDGNNEGQALQQPHFVWMHSTAKINLPKGKYDSRGVYMYFENYNVEVSNLCTSYENSIKISVILLLYKSLYFENNNTQHPTGSPETICDKVSQTKI